MATTTTSTCPNSSTNATIGEELFLVHLRRESAESEADLLKHRAKVGEELWKVHCQRVNGMNAEDDLDTDMISDTIQVATSAATAKLEKKTSSKKATAPLKKKPLIASTHQIKYNLRSKDSAHKKSK